MWIVRELKLQLETLVRNEPIMKFLVIKLATVLIVTLDLLLDWLFDWTLKKGSKLERDFAEKEGRSAQLHRHIATGNTFGSREFTRYQLHHLLLLHECYVHPEWVLANDNAYIWDIDKDQVFFCVTKPGVNLFDVSEHPWAWMHMSHEAEYVLVMSLSDFHRMAEKAGNPTARLTVMHTTPRGGSTLITHMMHKLPFTRAVAEAWILFYLERDAKAVNRDTEQVLTIFKNIVRIIARSPADKSKRLDHVFLKLTSSESNYFFALPKMFPNLTMIFNSRMPKKAIASFGRLSRKSSLPSLSLLAIQKVMGKKLNKWFIIPMPLDNPRLRAIADDILQNDMQLPTMLNNNYEEFISLRYMASVQNFLEHKDLYKLVVLYEDLAVDPEAVVTTLLEALGEPTHHLPLALQAMKVDSQKGYGGGIGAKDGHVVPQAIWKKIDSFAHKLEFPLTMDSSEEHFRDVLKL